MPAQYFATHFSGHQKVIDACIASLRPASDAASQAIISSLGRGGKVLAFGNGGSATQASHLVEELIGRFKETRRPLAAISLVSDSGVVTCIANDFGYDFLPKIIGDHSHMPMFIEMGRGSIQGLFAMGQNPAVSTDSRMERLITSLLCRVKREHTSRKST